MMKAPLRYLAMVLFLLWSGTICAQNGAAKAERLKCKVTAEYRHDAGSYTQGLFFYNGKLYESAGQYGESSMRITDCATGNVLMRRNFDKQYFIEGSCVCNNRLYILSWQEHVCFVCDPATLAEIGRLHYSGEGWGLTTDGRELIMSDGSAYITFRDPSNMAIRKSIKVTLDGQELPDLNELEYINGEIWANVYLTDFIVRINPDNGVVKSIIDCRDILPRTLRKPSTDVLNGIAYNPEEDAIYVTGKMWPRLYRIETVKANKKI